MSLVKGLNHKLAAVDLLVLNGDIFDFRWSYYPRRQASQAAAAAWLGRLHDDLPRCQIHLVLGNHDGLVSFQEELARLAPSLARFHWHIDCLQLGSALFLHGDCAQARMDARRLAEYRQAWEHKGTRGAWASGAYRCADWLGLTRLVHLWHFPQQRTVQRITYYLDHARPGWRREVRDCYFGHTHRPMNRFEFEGVRFHYSMVVIFAMVRNALAIPYSWLVRPRFLVYAWFPIEVYLWPGSLSILWWLLSILLGIKMLTGFIQIRRRM